MLDVKRLWPVNRMRVVVNRRYGIAGAESQKKLRLLTRGVPERPWAGSRLRLAVLPILKVFADETLEVGKVLDTLNFVAEGGEVR